ARASHLSTIAREKIVERAVPYQFAALFAATGADVDQIVCGANDLFLVLDNQQRVAFVAQVMHHAQQLADIARVQSDARFIHDKERADKRCAKTSREVYSLNFAAAQRARGSIKRKITDADLAQIIQARADF